MTPGPTPVRQPAVRPGQMTAVMQAMSVTKGPKVLRIGVVQNGRVVEERIIKQRITVTVGSSETTMFVIASQAVPPAFSLFERRGNDYFLNFLDGMTGRIALSTGITDLHSLRGSAKKAGAAHQVKLGDDARGKVVIGETTFLFQFVEPPPVQPRPQLPLAVKGGVTSTIDWTLTIVAAFSFLLHFGIIGAMYSDWLDPVLGDVHDVAGLVDMLGRIPTPPVVETPDTSAPIDLPPVKTALTDNTQKPPSKFAPNDAHPAGPPAQNNPGQISNERAAVLAAQAETLNIQMLVALNGGSSVQSTIDRGNVPLVDLGAVAERNVGVARGTGDLKITPGGAPVQASHDKGLGSLGNVKSEGTQHAGPETNVAGPTGLAQLGKSTASVAVPDADSVIANLRGRFRTCYQRGLDSDSTMSGKVLISAKIGPNGEVSSAEIMSNSGLSPAVGQCIANVVKRATFSAPGGGGSTLQIPVTFVQQSR